MTLQTLLQREPGSLTAQSTNRRYSHAILTSCASVEAPSIASAGWCGSCFGKDQKATGGRIGGRRGDEMVGLVSSVTAMTLGLDVL